MKKRKLSEDDKELWRKVSETTERLNAEPFKPSEPKSSSLPIPKPIKVDAPRIAPFKVGAKAAGRTPGHDLAPSISERVAQQPVKMDHKAYGKMKRGKIMPEGKIDLHGMTMDQAHPALIGFIMRSYGEGKRLVLVITGKGKSKQDDGPIPVRRGVLKHQVPQWLQMAPVAPVVLQVSEAHLRHGGTGAYYVYLRRPR